MPEAVSTLATNTTAGPVDAGFDDDPFDAGAAGEAGFDEGHFKALDRGIDALWSDILGRSRLVKAIRSGAATRELYAIYLMETHHYTLHNARNQAVVALRDTGNPVYAKFCLSHAADESGHELMALHDLRALGLDLGLGVDLDLRRFMPPAPLPATETLIAYLYWISAQGNSRRRLGYSYWAESCYEHINPLLSKLRHTLGLTDAQMTFFVAHSVIDAGHAAEVRRIMRRTCGPDDWQPIAEAAHTSLSLTGALLDAVYDEYLRFLEGRSERYAFLQVRERGALEAVR
ncbi:MAG: hypothetical protein JWQ11_3812 [Rhizobacter sp.]|nr:hypothetical protein [Rhizobacter sp.]